MNKYPLDKELKFLRHFNAPVGRGFLPIGSFILKICPKGFNKRKVNIKEIKIDKFKIIIVTPLELLNEVSPCLFYIHGGGFMYRSFPGHYHLMEEYAIQSRSKVIGIDYNLSPKHPFPHQINECIKAYKYILDNKEILKIDTNNIVIGGDSAGASLAMDTLLKIEESNLPKIKSLFLIYPVVDNRGNTESIKRFTDTPGWNSINNKVMWEYYLNGKDYKTPLLRIDEFNIKNLYIELAEYDCLHDEGLELFNALSEKTEVKILNETNNTFHAYDFNKKAKITIDSLNKRIEFLKLSFND